MKTLTLFLVFFITVFAKIANAQQESTVSAAILKEVQVSRDWRDVDISWTLKEGDYEIKTFIVERSKDGANFQKIGQIDHPDAIAEKFQLTDQNAKGTFCYYRIRVIETNGLEQTSKPLYAQFYNNPTLSLLSVVPNPSDNDIQLNMQLKENAYVLVRIVNSEGTEILQKKMKILSGNSLHTLQGTRHLIPGTYQLDVVINQKESLKISLVKA